MKKQNRCEPKWLVPVVVIMAVLVVAMFANTMTGNAFFNWGKRSTPDSEMAEVAEDKGSVGGFEVNPNTRTLNMLKEYCYN